MPLAGLKQRPVLTLQSLSGNREAPCAPSSSRRHHRIATNAVATFGSS